MRKTKIRLVSILIVILIIGMLPLVTLANSGEDIAIINTSEKNYILYIRKYTDKEFEYAFANDKNKKDKELSYNDSATDLEGNHCAVLDEKNYQELKDNPIYIWVKDNNGELILKGQQVDINNSIKKDNIETIEKMTQRISTKISTSKEMTEETDPVRKEEHEGIKEISKSGYIKILDDNNSKYYYQMIKMTDADEYTSLMKLIEETGKKYKELNIFEKIEEEQKIYDLYSNLINSVKWQNVENMEIKQPESTRQNNGIVDKYIVFLKKVDQNGQEITDIQILQEYYGYESNTIKENVKKQEASKLPITYDSIALVAILVIVIVALIITFIKMKKTNKKDEI